MPPQLRWLKASKSKCKTRSTLEVDRKKETPEEACIYWCYLKLSQVLLYQFKNIASLYFQFGFIAFIVFVHFTFQHKSLLHSSRRYKKNATKATTWPGRFSTQKRSYVVQSALHSFMHQFVFPLNRILFGCSVSIEWRNQI